LQYSEALSIYTPQVIDDVQGKNTCVGFNDGADVHDLTRAQETQEAAKAVGKLIAERALARYQCCRF
jgi:ribosomal protein L18